ncbi:MAG: hypothetical protein QXJ20_03060 [Candidatus Aenigmatarchaeota archaeon]
MVNKIASKKVLLVITIAIIAIVSIFFAIPKTGLLTFSFASKQEIESKVKEIFELSNPGTKIEIASFSEEGELYKILIKATGSLGTNYMEIYITKDGKYLIQNPISIEASIENIKRLNKLVDCLYEKGVRIYGLSNDTGTLLQFNVLGRSSTKLFVLCDGDMLQQCINAGIEEVPSIVINGVIYKGAKTADWLAEQAGCKI